jgi:hypothetical protein
MKMAAALARSSRIGLVLLGIGRPFKRRPPVTSATSEASQSEEGRRPGPGREALLDWVAGGIVLVVLALAQLAFRLGPNPYDPARYFWTAVDFSSAPANHWTLRIGLVVPVRLAVLLFGASETAFYAVPFAVGLVLAAAVYATMVMLFRDRLVAAAAALVTTLNTDWLLKSSSIFPDTAATATFTAGFFCLAAAARRPASDEKPWPTVFALCAGVLFGWTYLIREFSPILVPAVLAGTVLLRYPVRRTAALVGAALATASLELLYGFLRYRDPFIHARVVHNLDTGLPPFTPSRARATERLQEQFDGLLDTIVLYPRLLLGWGSGWFFLLLIAVFIVGLAVRFRDRRLWILAAWCFSFWIIMAVLGLGSRPSGRWIVDVTIIRYWYPVFPPLVMGAFGALVVLLPKRRLMGGRIALVHAVAVPLALLILVPGFIEFRRCEGKNVWPNDPAERWHELRSWFTTPEAERYDLIRTDVKTLRILSGFTTSTFGDPLWGGSEKELSIEGGRLVPPSGRPRSLILVDVRRGYWRRIVEPDEIRAEWFPIFTTDDGGMMLLAHVSGAAGQVRARRPWWKILAGSRKSQAEPGACGNASL